MLPPPHAGLSSASQAKLPSEYLNSEIWVAAFRSSVKGVKYAEIDSTMLERADKLLDILELRLRNHIAHRVDESRYNHFTLSFVRDNLPPMSAAMCLAGHVVDDLDAYGLEECLLKLPASDMLSIMTADLSSLEGCYLFFDRVKNVLIRSGKTSGDGCNATFAGRGNKHIENSKKVEQMIIHPLYQYFPAMWGGQHWCSARIFRKLGYLLCNGL